MTKSSEQYWLFKAQSSVCFAFSESWKLILEIEFIMQLLCNSSLQFTAWRKGIILSCYFQPRVYLMGGEEIFDHDLSKVMVNLLILNLD